MEEDQVIKIIQDIYEERIKEIKNMYQAIIEEKDNTIKQLQDRITDLETKLNQQNNRLIRIYNNNQYNYQTKKSDMSNVNQFHSGSGDNVGRDKNTTNIDNSQNLTETAKEIKNLLTELDQEYNSSTLVGAKAIEKIETNPTLKARFVNALKEGGTEALTALVDHPAVGIVVAAGKGFMDAK